MRIKDEEKIEALFTATIHTVNNIGFAASSVAKIAKAAKISPATIYIYHKNKEDLLVSVYIRIKQKMSAFMLRDFDAKKPIRDILHKLWFNAFDFVKEHTEWMLFAEQFSHSPFATLVNKEEVEKYYEPMIDVLNRGIIEKIIKDVNFDMLSAFIFFPVLNLSNPNLCQWFKPETQHIEQVFNMAWDAIKL